MNNRDYFDKPLQGNGRDFEGYGRTKLQDDDSSFAYGLAVAFPIAIAMWAVIYFVWEFCR